MQGMLDIDTQRQIAYPHLSAFAANRTEFYRTSNKLSLDSLLAKDVIMYAARGVATSDEYVAETFHATESSSEETVMGNTWQAIIGEISSKAVETGDLMVQGADALWVCELKSQTNTVNAASFPQEIRDLKEKVRIQSGFRRAGKQKVRAAYCVIKSKKSVDEFRVYHAKKYDARNEDIDGFEYRYLEGSAFWQWVVGIDGPAELIDDFSRIDLGDVVEARAEALARVTDELNQALDAAGLPHTIQGVHELKRLRTSAN